MRLQQKIVGRQKCSLGRNEVTMKKSRRTKDVVSRRKEWGYNEEEKPPKPSYGMWYKQWITKLNV